MAFPDVNPTDSVRAGGTQGQVQGQQQGQQQTVIVNVHTGEKTRKGKPIKGSVYNQPKPQTTDNRTTNTQTIGSNNTAYGGDNITVAGNGNMTTGRIENSTVAVGNGNQVATTEPSLAKTGSTNYGYVVAAGVVVIAGTMLVVARKKNKNEIA